MADNPAKFLHGVTVYRMEFLEGKCNIYFWDEAGRLKVTALHPPKDGNSQIDTVASGWEVSTPRPVTMRAK